MTRMRNTHVAMAVAVAIFALASGSVPAESIPVPGGEFNVYKPGTGYKIPATLPTGTYASGVGDNVPVKGGLANYADGTTGTLIDCPGWVSIHGAAPDLLDNGVAGSIGFNAFAAWGGDVRAQSSASLGQVESGAIYTISAMINGGVANGPLAFYLLADGVPMTPSSSVEPVTPVTSWQTISRTYDAAAVAGHVGTEMKIVIGVEDANDLVGRMIYDNITLEAESSPRDGTVLLLR